jgi:antitoxin CptB
MAEQFDDLTLRRRRARYRAEHRGTKEMDWLLGRYAVAHLDGMDEQVLERFELLLALPDPELQAMLMGGRPLPLNDIGPLLGAIRAHHGLGEADSH